MPIYEYECKECKNSFSVNQKITDNSIPDCPECKGECEKLISKSSFILVGPGFYVNDYKNKGKIK